MGPTMAWFSFITSQFSIGGNFLTTGLRGVGGLALEFAIASKNPHGVFVPLRCHVPVLVFFH